MLNLLLLHLALLFQTSAAALPPDAAALLSFKSQTDPSNHLNFSLKIHHCNWPGVQCSSSPEPNRITKLILESSSLNGTIPDLTLSLLDQLRVLSLKSNSLSGPIPDLSPLINLRSLFLSHNRLYGPIPSSIFSSLRRLRTLDLSHNSLSGPIPSSLLLLPRLSSLLLHSNLLNGSLPPFNQPSLTSLNVSHNLLSGPLPITTALSSLDPSSFSSNPDLCGELVRRQCPNTHLFFFHRPAPPPPSSARLPLRNDNAQDDILLPAAAPHRFRKKAALAAAFLLAVALIAAGLVVASLVLKKRATLGMKSAVLDPLGAKHAGSAEGDEESVVEEIEQSNNELVAAAAVAMSEEKVKKLGRSGSLVFCAGEAGVYSLEQLMRASAEMLGRGSVGSTYKAVLDNRIIVSVKRVDAGRMGVAGKEGFERHMESVGRLRHPNLVALRAYFQAKEERLIVYDYQPNGSLYSLIHGSRSTRAKPLHWTSCLKIAEDVAQGLAYIHQASRLVHGNLKSSNVLLGSDFEACLTDNCLLSLVEPSDGEDNSGYRAPETHKSDCQLTPRSDIYAFGVLLLELLTGKPPLQHAALMATDLLTWVRSVREDEGTDDERLMMIVDIAAACVQSSPESRPTTWQVLKMIQEVKETDAEGDNENASSFIS